MSAKRTLLLVDDHPVFHEGLGSILSAKRPGWDLVGAYSVAEGLAALAQRPDVDLVLIDLMMPVTDGFEAIAAFGRASPEIPRVVISGREDGAARLRARHGGASGFIAKSWGGELIAEVIDRVLGGESGFHDEGDTPSGGQIALTPRQIDVLTLLAEGLPNKSIEDRLGIAERTVRSHLTELFAVLGAQTRTQAVLRAQKLGLIP